ncbi:MAG TPA: hypothetical protein VJ576_09655 [Rhodocyclaceae bacterium]|nr:hypothetical protein [Rhodocyclaceae bacterium]
MRYRPIPDAIQAIYPSVPSQASVMDMFSAFEAIDGLMAELATGEITMEGPAPVMRDWEGDWCEVSPALHGWCDCWERIARAMGQPLDLAFLRRLASRLENGVLLCITDLDRASALIDRCRALYLACPTRTRQAAVLDERIAIALDEHGLRRAA